MSTKKDGKFDFNSVSDIYENVIDAQLKKVEKSNIDYFEKLQNESFEDLKISYDDYIKSRRKRSKQFDRMCNNNSD